MNLDFKKIIGYSILAGSLVYITREAIHKFLPQELERLASKTIVKQELRLSVKKAIKDLVEDADIERDINSLIIKVINSIYVRGELKTKVLQLVLEKDVQNNLAELLRNAFIQASNDETVKLNLKEMITEIINDKAVTKGASSSIASVIYDLMVPEMK
uniref:Uncharacterized protein n=1 Tax=viral metagenome TaxID=1070528 RepID=A0A6C0ACB7_9ZZZZ